MVRISKKSIIFGLLLVFLFSCSIPEYQDITRHNYDDLDNFINSDFYSGNTYVSYPKHKKLEYDYTKLKNYTGYYKVGNPYKINGKTYYPKEDKNYKEVGIASWYGDDFHNKKTANGEIYNMHDFTCAHRTLPMPSLVRITNLQNGKSIVARVNDRGPFAKDRIVDVSKNIAKELDFYSQGTTKVKIEFLEKETKEMLEYLKIQ